MTARKPWVVGLRLGSVLKSSMPPSRLRRLYPLGMLSWQSTSSGPSIRFCLTLSAAPRIFSGPTFAINAITTVCLSSCQRILFVCLIYHLQSSLLIPTSSSQHGGSHRRSHAPPVRHSPQRRRAAPAKEQSFQLSPAHRICQVCDKINLKREKLCTCTAFTKDRLCTVEYRVASYFRLLRKAGLYPRNERLETLSVDEVFRKIQAMVKDSGHRCRGGLKCPLKVALKNVLDEALAIRTAADFKWTWK